MSLAPKDSDRRKQLIACVYNRHNNIDPQSYIPYIVDNDKVISHPFEGRLAYYVDFPKGTVIAVFDKTHVYLPKYQKTIDTIAYVESVGGKGGGPSAQFLYFTDGEFVNMSDDSNRVFIQIISVPESSEELVPMRKVTRDEQRMSVGCFSGKASVKSENGINILVETLKKGDSIQTSNGYQRIRAITKSLAPKNALIDVDGLVITKYHPIVAYGEWVFPINHPNAKEENINSCDVYSILFEERGISGVIVNDILCATLGHGFTDKDEYPTIGHKFFGDYDAVVKSLETLGLSTSLDGVIDVILQRNEENDDVVGFIRGN